MMNILKIGLKLKNLINKFNKERESNMNEYDKSMMDYLEGKYSKYSHYAFDNLDVYKKLYYTKNKVETDEEKVIRIIKGDFEKEFNITFDKFQTILKDIMGQHPEKLI